MTWQRWYEHDTTKARYRQMQPPYERVFIGSDPTDGFTLLDAQSFDAIVNVSDTPCAYFDPAKPSQRMHWFPISEVSYWGHAPFYWAKHVLDFHYARKDKVLLHCHAGACRSPAMFVWWLISRGVPPEEAFAREWGSWGKPEEMEKWRAKGYLDWRQHMMVRTGSIPETVFELYKRMKADPTYSLGSVLLQPDLIAKTTDVMAESGLRRERRYRRFKWYYKARYWLRDKRSRFQMYRKGKRWMRISFGLQDRDIEPGETLWQCLFVTPAAPQPSTATTTPTAPLPTSAAPQTVEST